MVAVGILGFKAIIFSITTFSKFDGVGATESHVTAVRVKYHQVM